jgi:hypothetical protein
LRAWRGSLLVILIDSAQKIRIAAKLFSKAKFGVFLR